MKKITKKIIFVLTVSLLSCLFLGCSEKPEQIIHSPEAAKTIEGSWKLNTKSQATMHPDPEEPNFILGLLTYTTETIQKFLPDQEFESVMTQKGESFTFTEKDTTYGFTEQELIDSADKSILVKGKYTVSENKILFDYDSISVNGGEFINYDEFIIQNPAFGQNHVSMDWDIRAGKLNFYQKLNGKDMSVSYSKVE